VGTSIEFSSNYCKNQKKPIDTYCSEIGRRTYYFWVRTNFDLTRTVGQSRHRSSFFPHWFRKKTRSEASVQNTFANSSG
jgi:hypothetical protein